MIDVNSRIRAACGIEHEVAATVEKAPEEERRRPALEAGSRYHLSAPDPWLPKEPSVNALLQAAIHGGY